MAKPKPEDANSTTVVTPEVTPATGAPEGEQLSLEDAIKAAKDAAPPVAEPPAPRLTRAVKIVMDDRPLDEAATLQAMGVAAVEEAVVVATPKRVAASTQREMAAGRRALGFED